MRDLYAPVVLTRGLLNLCFRETEVGKSRKMRGTWDAEIFPSRLVPYCLGASVLSSRILGTNLRVLCKHARSIFAPVAMLWLWLAVAAMREIYLT
jgi:hypothetical protein